MKSGAAAGSADSHSFTTTTISTFSRMKGSICWIFSSRRVIRPISSLNWIVAGPPPVDSTRPLICGNMPGACRWSTSKTWRPMERSPALAKEHWTLPRSITPPSRPGRGIFWWISTHLRHPPWKARAARWNTSGVRSILSERKADALATSSAALAGRDRRGMDSILSWLTAPWGSRHRRRGPYSLPWAQPYQRERSRGYNYPRPAPRARRTERIAPDRLEQRRERDLYPLLNHRTMRDVRRSRTHGEYARNPLRRARYHLRRHITHRQDPVSGQRAPACRRLREPRTGDRPPGYAD